MIFLRILKESAANLNNRFKPKIFGCRAKAWEESRIEAYVFTRRARYRIVRIVILHEAHVGTVTKP